MINYFKKMRGEPFGMKNMIIKLLKYILIFFIAVGFLFFALVGVAFIPQENIKDNVYESAQYYIENEIFEETVEGVKGSILDRYADTILVAIAYQYDEDKPVESVIKSSYYHDDLMNENDNLMLAVSEGLEPNQQYLRYWHGANVILRPLLLLFDVEEIYVINAILLGIMSALLIGVLTFKKAYTLVAGIGIGIVMTSGWIVPFSFEYTWTYGLMMLMSILVVCMAYKDKWEYIGFVFMVGGILTNYLDFLTTETLTCTVPLLILIWLKSNQTNKPTLKEIFVFSGKNILLWGAGYVGMWISKWIIASIVLGENVMPYITGHMGERIDGDLGLNPVQYIFSAVTRNLSCLFPFEYGGFGAMLGILMLVFAFYVGYVHYGKKEDKSYIWIYFAIAMIPYIRYMVLHNHAYLHYFFTYRAQLATVLAVVLILELLTDRRWFARGKARRKRT